MTPAETVCHFIRCINRWDVDRLAECMTGDHVFVDSLGNSVHGREAMRGGWRGYFQLCPDYRVSLERVLSDGKVVAVFGTAGGTIRGCEWHIPAAWLAVVEEGLVKEWRVYADNKPVYDILRLTAPTATGPMDH